MKGIKFGNYHSHDDWGLILSAKEIQSPAPKKKQIEIEGSDGVLDYTEYFGEVKFNNRSLSFTFTAFDKTQEEFVQLYSDIHNAIHGQKMKVILDDDPDFYYMGRVEVNEWKASRNLREIVIEVDAEPYKMKAQETTILTSLSGKNIFDWQNPNYFFRAGTDVASIETGIRISLSRPIPYGYAIYAIAESKYLVGKTISISWNVRSVDLDRYIVVLGYANSGSDFKKIIETATKNKLTMHVDESNSMKYNNVIFWLYSNRATALPVGEYIDYTNIQVEINDDATEYVAFDNNQKTVEVIANNMRKKVVPTLIASKNMTISKGNTSISIQGNTEYKVPQMELSTGNNAFSVTGTSGLILVKYQEGGL